MLRHHICPKYLQSIRTKKSFELLNSLLNKCPLELRKYDCPTYHMSLLGQHLTHQEQRSAASSMYGSLVFEEAIHLGYNTVSQAKWCPTIQRALIPWIGQGSSSDGNMFHASLGAHPASCTVGTLSPSQG
jgi:hypothetical protein